MPSTKKRVNLTLPDDIYERLQAYERKNGLTNDATACLQLVVKQLNAIDQSEIVLNYISSSSLEQLNQLSAEGMEALKLLAKKK